MAEDKFIKLKNYHLDFNRIKSDIDINSIQNEKIKKALSLFDSDKDGKIQRKNSSGQNETESIWKRLSDAAGKDELKEELSLEELSTIINSDSKNKKADTNDLADGLIQFIGIRDNKFFDKRRSSQFDEAELGVLEKLTPEQQKRVSQVLYLENRPKNNQLEIFDMYALAHLEAKEFDRAVELLTLKGREKSPLDLDSDIKPFIGLPDEEFEKVKSLIYLEDRDQKSQFRGREIKTLLEIPQENSAKAEYLMKFSKLSGENIKKLSNSTDEEFEKIKDILTIGSKGDVRQLSGAEIEHLRHQPEEIYNKAIKLLQNKEINDSEFGGFGAVQLAKLSKKEFKNAMQLFYLKNDKKNPINLFGICELAKAADFNTVKSLTNIENRKKQLKASELISLARVYNEDLEKFIKDNPNFRLEDSNRGYFKNRAVTIKAENGNDAYIYDKKGLVEITQVTPGEKIPGYKSTEHVKVKNVRNNIEQEILRGMSENGHNRPLLISDTIKYFDNNNNLIKTMVCKQDNNKGTMNVSETYPDGKTVPIQFMSIDPQSGAMISERNMISPEGVKTRFYYEEKNDLRISNYTITDADGKKLMEIEQTFEKISDNKFISSINKHPYKIEFLDDSIKILDVATKKTTTINTNNLILANGDEKQKIIEILKQVPANQLLMMKKLPIAKITFNEQNTNNGNWNVEKKTLELGNYDNVNDSQNAYLKLFTHEFGHFMDLAENKSGTFSEDPLLIKIAEEEFEELKKNTTFEQQKYVMYFTEDANVRENCALTESVAEANSVTNSVSSSVHNTRQFYFQMYFPRRIARIMELIHQKQGI